MVIANILGILSFLYLYWKRLKEDYHHEKVFNSAFIVLIGLTIGIVFSKFILNNYWFWILFIAVVICEIINIYKLKLKIFESIEGLTVGLLSWVSIFFLSDSIIHSSLSSFLSFWLALICIFLFFFFNNFYKTYTWYKSGRVGFSGLATLGIFFLLRSVMAVFFKEVISFSGVSEPFISGTVAFIFFLLLFNLSKNKS